MGGGAAARGVGHVDAVAAARAGLNVRIGGVRRDRGTEHVIALPGVVHGAAHVGPAGPVLGNADFADHGGIQSAVGDIDRQAHCGSGAQNAVGRGRIERRGAGVAHVIGVEAVPIRGFRPGIGRAVQAGTGRCRW